MAANPIYVETEEEMPEVIERIRRTPAPEIPLVLPVRSRIGQSRFNFQLLKQYANQLGKRVAIISADPAVQQMAEETGFPSYRAVDQYGLTPEQAALQPAPPPSAAPKRGAPAQPAPARILVPKPARLQSKVATEVRPGRLLLYIGSLLILTVGIVGAAVYVPSAQVTLVAIAQPFAADNVQVNSQPGQAPVRIRVVSEQKQASGGFSATGVKVTPAAIASGTATFTNSCPGVDVTVNNGARIQGANGQTYAVKGDSAKMQPGGSTVGAVIASAPGGAWNTGPINGTFASGGSCVAISGLNAAGGADEQKQTQFQQSDYEAARSALEQQIRGDIAADLAKQVQSGEKLADTAIQFSAPNFATDHKVGDIVTGFNGTMTIKAEGAFYVADDVTKAFAASLDKKVAAGQQLVPNKTVADYTVAGSPGGNLTFTGAAKGFVAPKLDTDRIKGRLVARTIGQATSDLSKLPGVSTAVITEKPFRLPIMPLVSSRISITYDIRQGAPTTPKSG